MITRLKLYTTLVLIFMVATASLAYANYTSTLTFESQIKQKRILLAQSREQLEQQKQITEEAKTVLGRKRIELQAKEEALAQLNQDLNAKLKYLDVANGQVRTQQAKIAANAAELSKLRTQKPLFSFKVESQNIKDVERKKEELKQVVTAAYDVMVEVYSNPYLLNQVVISFVDTLSIPGAYAQITVSNSSSGLSLTIKLKDFNKDNFLDVNAIIHEILHSFHGLAFLEPPAYEEGITIAATEAVMHKLIAQGKIPAFNPLYIRLSTQDYLRTSTRLPSDESFYGSDQTSTYYQIAGIGWYEIYKADPNFFKVFNEKVYQKARNGEPISSQLVRNLIKESTSVMVQGRTIQAWTETKAFQLQ